MKPNRFLTRVTLFAVALALCGVPQFLQAQSAQPAPVPAQQETPSTTAQPPDASVPTQPAAHAQAAPATQATPDSQNSAQQPAPAQGNTGIVDPSKGPLTPVPSNSQELPNAPSATQAPAQNQTTPQPAPTQTPAGAAAAQTGPTAGGAASKPAGNAIAPAKQRQVRSLLIKLGAIAAAGAAIGTVVALSKGSPSTPPGAR